MDIFSQTIVIFLTGEVKYKILYKGDIPTELANKN